MKPPVWRVPDDGELQVPASPTAEAGLVSLPFLVAAVRRKWRRVVATAGVCALLALGMTQMGGGQHAASATLLLTNDPSADPASAMTTDLSLLRTRSVSEEVVKKLDLPLSPDSFVASVTALPLSDQLLTVTVTAPSDPEAITRVNALASVYLAFLGEQHSALAKSTIEANDKYIAALSSQIEALTKRYEVAASTPGQEQLASTLLTDRAQLQGEVYNADQENAQTKLQAQAIIGASHVVDGAAIVQKKSRIKGIVLAVMSGLIGGTALGLGLVLVPAILSPRLRRRDDVARALGVPVRFSAGPVSSRWWWVPWSEVRHNAERLAHGLATALPQDVDTARLTVATVGDVRDGAYVVGALADELAREATAVAVIDLSASGVLAKPPRRLSGRADPIDNRQLVKVNRHDVRVSALAARARDRVSSDEVPGRAEVILTLIELDPGAGVDVLGELGDVCVVMVSTGRASAERLRSTATLLRQSDIHPDFAMLAGADEADDSSGLLERPAARDASSRRFS